MKKIILILFVLIGFFIPTFAFDCKSLNAETIFSTETFTEEIFI